VSRGEHSSATLRDFSRKALVDLKDVIKLYTEQLRLMEKHCAMLNRECGHKSRELEEAYAEIKALRESLCRESTHSEPFDYDSAEQLEACAAYASQHGWADIAKSYSDWAKSVSLRMAKTGGGA
jgi:hypothetical protein